MGRLDRVRSPRNAVAYGYRELFALAGNLLLASDIV